MLQSGKLESKPRIELLLSSATYWIQPESIRKLDLELTVRDAESAYKHLPELTDSQRSMRYEALRDSIRSGGFDPRYPIIVLLNRMEFGHDKLLQGHHRLNIAIELGLDKVPVRFAYASNGPGDSSQ